MFQNSINPNAPRTQGLDTIVLLLQVPLDQGMLSSDGAMEANMDRGTHKLIIPMVVIIHCGFREWSGL